jgi:hypothetical protein
MSSGVEKPLSLQMHNWSKKWNSLWIIAMLSISSVRAQYSITRDRLLL